MVENLLNGLEIIAIIVALLAVAFIGVRIFGRENSFENAQDRDSTVAMLLVFGMFIGVLWIFKGELTGNIITGLVMTLSNLVGMIIGFYFKEKRNKDGGSP